MNEVARVDYASFEDLKNRPTTRSYELEILIPVDIFLNPGFSPVPLKTFHSLYESMG